MINTAFISFSSLFLFFFCFPFLFLCRVCFRCSVRATSVSAFFSMLIVSDVIRLIPKPFPFASRSHRVRPRSVTLCSDEKHRLSIERRCKDSVGLNNVFTKNAKKYFLQIRNRNVSSLGFLEIPNEAVIHLPGLYPMLDTHHFSCLMC